jgi:hypothetical protein
MAWCDDERDVSSKNIVYEQSSGISPLDKPVNLFKEVHTYLDNCSRLKTWKDIEHVEYEYETNVDHKLVPDDLVPAPEDSENNATLLDPNKKFAYM